LKGVIMAFELKDYNIWNLDELTYDGELYHYTSDENYEKIFNPLNYPDDCISLQFTRIDCMTKNDLKERRHIQDSIIETVNHLLENKKITQQFADIVLFNKTEDKGYYRYTTDEIDYSFRKPQNIIKIGYGIIDYFVACFSTDPNNEYIKSKFGTTQCIAFNSFFANPEKEKSNLNWFRIVGNYINEYPYSCIRSCFLDYFIKRVVYSNSEKNMLITQRLLEIQTLLPDKRRVLSELQLMYYLYEAFFKGEQFIPEKEVRFVIRLPRTEFPMIFKQNNIIFDKTKEHLYLPISKDFIL